jgi:hypothetical protein
MRKKARYCPHCGVPAIRTALSSGVEEVVTPVPSPTLENSRIEQTPHRVAEADGDRPPVPQLPDPVHPASGEPVLGSRAAGTGLFRDPPASLAALILLAAALVFLLAWLAMG